MSTVPVTLFNSIGHAAVASVKVVIGLKTAWERRRVVGQLALLDDYMLRDIGLTRQDLYSVMAEPLYRDPTERLAARATESRQARRNAAHDLSSDQQDGVRIAIDIPGRRAA